MSPLTPLPDSGTSAQSLCCHAWLQGPTETLVSPSVTIDIPAALQVNSAAVAMYVELCELQLLQPPRAPAGGRLLCERPCQTAHGHQL